MSEMVIDNKIKENKLGVMPIPKLLLTMSLPAIFSMLVLSLYNIVDSLFVAKVSGLALDAVSFAFPLQQIMLAFSLGVGVGTSTIVARRLGEKNKADADTLAQTGFKMA
ncbi:MAG TPA: MATE family efflux transporter, partial [Clostridia bacterium]|nr:MATE family efflux transporter [Clostridia bacterium]